MFNRASDSVISFFKLFPQQCEIEFVCTVNNIVYVGAYGIVGCKERSNGNISIIFKGFIIIFSNSSVSTKMNRCD